MRPCRFKTPASSYEEEEKPKNINNVSVGGPALQRARAFDLIINYYGPVIVSAPRTKKKPTQPYLAYFRTKLLFFSSSSLSNGSVIDKGEILYSEKQPQFCSLIFWP